MRIDAHTAAIDNDFINHLVETKFDDEKLVAVLSIVFSELNLSAIMHPLVYEKELLKDNARIKLLFGSNVVSNVSFDDILQNDAARKDYYIYLVTELYRSLNGDELPAIGEDVFAYWAHKKSLGEIHSIAMCLICECGVFLSDDKDSKALKRYVERSSIGKVDVYNREEFINKHMQEGITKINRKARQALAHSVAHYA